MRQRTQWTWRLRLYPIVVIPLMVYFVAAQGGESYRPDAERINDQSGTDVATGAAHPNNAALHGIHKGRAVTCFTDPDVTLCYELKQPETVMDR